MTAVVFHQNFSSIIQGNKNREHPVSDHVLQNQFDRLEWVELDEAHRVAFVDDHLNLRLFGSVDDTNFSSSSLN